MEHKQEQKQEGEFIFSIIGKIEKDGNLGVNSKISTKLKDFRHIRIDTLITMKLAFMSRIRTLQLRELYNYFVMAQEINKAKTFKEFVKQIDERSLEDFDKLIIENDKTK